jgi:nitroreductase
MKIKIQEQIIKRRSVRTYSGEPLKNEHIAEIEDFISAVKAPFGVNARVRFMNVHSGEKPLKLGTYGWVSNAPGFLALIYEEAPFDQEAAAYMFEQVILYCTGLGLGTCWLGGSFSRGDFKNQLPLKENEKLRIVSPVGYEAEKKRWFLEKIIVNADKNHATRKPFGDLFFDKTFEKSLTEENAGIYAEPLKMVRLAPSANNKQEWRIVLDKNILHFYKKPYLMFDRIDIGIALCHFEETCKELNINGKFEFLEHYPQNDGLKYVISRVS